MPSQSSRIAAIAAFTFAMALTACGASNSATPAATTTGTTAVASTAPTSTGPAPTSTTAPAGASTTPSVAPASPVPAACTETRDWNTNPSTGTGFSQDALYLVRAGQHPCYDRLVFDVNGPAQVGFDVRYVPVVLSDAKGDPLPVPGGATLRVVVRAPELGADNSGHQPGRVLANTGDFLYPASQLAGWTSLRAVRFAGSFEGQSTFAVGISGTLPFRAFTLLDTPDQVRRVVVDIAHS